MSGLTPKQLEAVSAIARGITPSVIGKSINVSERTIQRWMKLPEFVEAVQEIRQQSTVKVIAETSKDVSERIQSLIPKAIDTLESYLDNPGARGSDRLRACHILGTWAGLAQTQKTDPQHPPEETLKSYLSYLSANGNSQAPDHG